MEVEVVTVVGDVTVLGMMVLVGLVVGEVVGGQWELGMQQRTRIL